MEAIVLAGGLGTRLRSEISSLPKVLAPINNKPFLTFLLHTLQRYGVRHCVLATGYLHDKVYQAIGVEYAGIQITYSREPQPLGTGGALHLALNRTSEDYVLILNGDTLFNVDLRKLMDWHQEKRADITIGLCEMRNIARYGTVTLGRDDRVVSFQEKQHRDIGMINGGVYAVRRGIFESFDLPNRFSFEDDFLQKHCEILRIHGFVSQGYFIDIGIPEDYQRAQRELPKL